MYKIGDTVLYQATGIRWQKVGKINKIDEAAGTTFYYIEGSEFDMGYFEEELAPFTELDFSVVGEVKNIDRDCLLSSTDKL